MALVDYESSGEESADECEDDKARQTFTPKHFYLNSENQNLSVSGIAKEKNSLFSSLPKPVNNFSFLGDDSKLKKLLQNKSENVFSAGKPGSGSVKIYVPSVAEFKEEPLPKKLKSSVKSVGLFSILPPPKNISVKEPNRTLIPKNVVKNQPNETVENKTTAKSHNLKCVYKSTTEIKEEDDEDDSIIGDSFFGICLSESSEGAGVLNDKTGDINASSSKEFEFLQEKRIPCNISLLQHEGNFKHVSQSTSSTTENLVADGYCKKVLSSQQTNASENNPLELDEKALQILCGGKRKRQKIPLDFIELSGEEIMPDSKEWLRKQLTEDRKVKSHSHRKNQGPSTQQRRKHQITYLAFQAKEQELELQNQWANNRMSRKQTQSKYGF